MNPARSSPLTLGKKKTAVTEAQWVRSESIRHVMASVVNTQLLMFCAMVFMAVLLYGHASTPALLAWFGINSILSTLRLWLLRGYSESDKSNNIAERAVYFIRYAKLAPFNGFIWGVSVFLFNGIPTPNIAIFCLIIVLVFGMFSVSNLSSYLRLNEPRHLGLLCRFDVCRACCTLPSSKILCQTQFNCGTWPWSSFLFSCNFELARA